MTFTSNLEPVLVKYISPSDKGFLFAGSHARQAVVVGDKGFALWTGYALVKPGVTAMALDIVTPSQQRGVANVPSMRLPAKAIITSLAFMPLDDIELGVAGGFLKLSYSLANDGGGGLGSQSVYSDATPIAILRKKEKSYRVDFPLSTAAEVPTGMVTRWRIFATDASGLVGSTMKAAKKTKILASIGFYVPYIFPSEGEVGFSAPENEDN